MINTISIELLNTLSRGVSALGDEARQRVVAFVESQRSADGGFCDKSGQVDIYYTSFGMSLSLALGIDFDTKKIEYLLQQIDVEQLDLVHYAAYMRCRMLNNFADNKLGFALKALQRIPIRELTSFSALPNNDVESPYSQFITYSLLEDTNNRTLEVSFDKYKTPQGFSNTPNGPTASTNATSAALMVMGQATGYNDKGGDITLLRNMQHECGGFKADSATPMPDLLSTATALFTLRCYDVEPKYSAAEFIEAHWLDSGGFAATILDSESDVEYTFYGLLALGTL